MTDIFAILGETAILTTTANVVSFVKAEIAYPNRDDLVGDAPMSLSNRWIALTSTAASTGDLITINGATWMLARSPDPDSMSLTRRWIGVPLSLPAGSYPLTYHEDGYPLVVWDLVQWVSA